MCVFAFRCHVCSRSTERLISQSSDSIYSSHYSQFRGDSDGNNLDVQKSCAFYVLTLLAPIFCSVYRKMARSWNVREHLCGLTDGMDRAWQYLFSLVSPGEWVTVEGRFRCVSLTCMSSSCPRSPQGLSPSAHLADGTGDLILVSDTDPLGFLKFLYRHTGTQDQVWPRSPLNKTGWLFETWLPFSFSFFSSTCRLWRSIVSRLSVSLSPLIRTDMKRLGARIRSLVKTSVVMRSLEAGMGLSSTWQREKQGERGPPSRKQWAPSCVVCAVAKLLLCQCGTVMERFCVAQRSSAGRSVFWIFVYSTVLSTYWK